MLVCLLDIFFDKMVRFGGNGPGNLVLCVMSSVWFRCLCLFLAL